MANITKIKLPSGDTYDIVDEKSGYITSDTLPIATASTLGGIKVGSGLNIDASTGVLSATGTSLTIDTAISTTSTNPVQNKAIGLALADKADVSDIPTNVSELTNDAGYVTTDENVLQTVDHTSNGMLSMMFTGHNTETSGVYKSSKITFTPSDSRLRVSASTVGQQGESIYMDPNGIGFNDGSHGTAVVRLSGNYSQTSSQTFYLPNKDGGTFALISDVPTASELLDMFYPVGAIYISVNSTSPATLFGGEWTQIQDQFLLSAGSTYTAGNTGGNATHTHTTGDHTLTARESGIRQHTHPDTFAISSSGKVEDGITGGSHGHTANYRSVYNGNSNYSAVTGSGGTSTTTNAIISSGSHTHDLPNHTHTISGSVSNVSASAALDAHNHGNTGSASNLPPYLVVYMWKRTA